MADNPFSVSVVNPLQALLIGQQAYTTGQEAQKQQALTQARNEAGALYQAGDTKGALSRLLMGGDLQGAGTYSTLDNNQWTRQHTEKQDARQAGRDAVTDQHWNADYGLRKASADEGKFVVKEVTDPNTGGTSLIRVKTTGAEGPIPTGVAPSTPNNPYAYGKQNEAQSKDSGYANRMFDAEQTLRDPKVIEAGTSIKQAGIEGIPLIPDAAKNWAHTPEYQKYDQAQRNMINAILRRESGAAISQSEFDNAYKQYIPRVGDSPEKLAEKQRNRQAAIAGIAGGGGQSYKPPYVFGPNGEMMPTGAPAQGATGVPPPKSPAALAPDGLSGSSVVASSAPQDPRFPPPPKIGESRGGYRFKGGNPGEPSNWAKVSN